MAEEESAGQRSAGADGPAFWTSSIYIFADGGCLPQLIDCLFRRYEVSVEDIRGLMIDSDDHSTRSSGTSLGIDTLSPEAAAASLHDDDVVIVAGSDFERRLDRMYSLGVRGLYDGNALLRDLSPAERFATRASGYFVGPIPTTHRDPGSLEASRYRSDPLRAGRIPASRLFLVNSLPKSGSIWLIAMLEKALGLRAREQIILSHVGDIETDWCKPNNHGAVLLLRDLRDVVVSWFHHAMRSDLQQGYANPRYPDVDSFYWEFLLGMLQGSKRYYYGDLGGWVDRMCASYTPVLTYERLCDAPVAEVKRVLNAWRVQADDKVLAKAIKDCEFDTMKDGYGETEGYVKTMLDRAHLRKGKPGSWQGELPPDIAQDIESRFGEYQQRVRTISNLARLGD